VPSVVAPFLLRQFLAFGDLLKLRVQLRQLAGVQAQLGDSALVIDRHRGLVGDGAAIQSTLQSRLAGLKS
jgi:hypothetical protein